MWGGNTKWIESNEQSDPGMDRIKGCFFERKIKEAGKTVGEGDERTRQ